MISHFFWWLGLFIRICLSYTYHVLSYMICVAMITHLFRWLWHQIFGHHLFQRAAREASKHETDLKVFSSITKKWFLTNLVNLCASHLVQPFLNLLPTFLNCKTLFCLRLWPCNPLGWACHACHGVSFQWARSHWHSNRFMDFSWKLCLRFYFPLRKEVFPFLIFKPCFPKTSVQSCFQPVKLCLLHHFSASLVVWNVRTDCRIRE